MPELMPFIIVAFIILFILIAVLGYYQRQKRLKELAAFAAARGLTFDPGRDHELEDRFPAFECLRQGSGRYAYNRTYGRWNGRDLLAFDYHYETHSTDSKGRRKTHHHHFSGVILGSDVPLRPLVIRAEGFFDKVAGFFGFDDIDFESAEFSREFYVKSPDRKWAYDVIHTRTMEFLLSQPRFSIQFDRACILVHRSSTFSPGEFAAAAGVAEGILNRLPDYLLQQQREQA
jgi:hypothetical protein